MSGPYTIDPEKISKLKIVDEDTEENTPMCGDFDALVMESEITSELEIRFNRLINSTAVDTTTVHVVDCSYKTDVVRKRS